MSRLCKWVAGGIGALTTAVVVALALPTISAAGGGYCTITATSTLRGHAGETFKVFGNYKQAASVQILLSSSSVETTNNRTRAIGVVPDWTPGNYDLRVYCSDVDGSFTYYRQFTILPTN